MLRFNPKGETTGNWELSRILGNNEKAKVGENRKMFLEEDFDLAKNKGMIPHNYIFEDAQLFDGRVYLLLENRDILGKKLKPFIEFIEIDMSSWAVKNTFRADTQAKWESASNFVFIGDIRNPAFLTSVRIPGEDTKLCIFKPMMSSK